MSKITQFAAPSSLASAALSAKTFSAASRDSQPAFTRGTTACTDAMKRAAPNDFNSPEPKRNRSNDPLPEIRNMHVIYNPRTTPRNNSSYDPSMDRYLGLNQANPSYDPSLDQYLSR